MQTYPFF
jgi:hypothetical protein